MRNEPTLTQSLIGLVVGLGLMFGVIIGIAASLDALGLVSKSGVQEVTTQKPKDDWGMTNAAVVGVIGQM